MSAETNLGFNLESVSVVLRNGTTEAVVVSEPSFGEEAQFEAHFARILPHVASAARSVFEGGTDAAALVGKAQAFAGLLALCGEYLYALICLSTGKPRDWLNSITRESGINLVSALVKVNAPFFVRVSQGLLGSLTQKV